MPTGGSPTAASVVGGLLALVFMACSAQTLTVLPENPCDLLTVRQVASASGVEVDAANRALSQRESFEAGGASQERPAGSICSYVTRSDLGSISVIFPDRRGPIAPRSAPVECGPEPLRGEVAPVDARAWVSGGTAVVCVGPNLFVWVSVQMAHDARAGKAASGVARAILRRLPS